MLWLCFIHYIFLDQEVDGETLLLLSSSGSVDQLRACGFKTIKEQLKLKKLLSEEPTQPSMAMDVKPNYKSTSKLTLSEMKCMSPDDKRLYLSK